MAISSRLFALLAALAAVTSLFAPVFAAGVSDTGETLILATTYSVSDTGLLDVVLKDFKAKTGVGVKPIIVGSGESLKMGERGECDVVIAHSRELEEKFMADGFGRDRRSIAKNEFYVVGPEADPAKVSEAKDVYDAYARIDSSAVFVSRGDRSGTHNREAAIWKKAGIEKKASEKYVVTGQGMAETLRITEEKLGYTMCDSATFTVLRDKIKVRKLFADPANLTNVYSVITVNPDRAKNAKYGPAKKFFDFMFEPSTLAVISGYGADKYGSPLFTLLDDVKK